MTNKFQTNSHLQGTNEGKKNKEKESKIICFVALNQTLDKEFDYSGETYTRTSLLSSGSLLCYQVSHQKNLL